MNGIPHSVDAPSASTSSSARSLTELVDKLHTPAESGVETSEDWADIFDSRYGEWPKNWSRLTPLAR